MCSAFFFQLVMFMWVFVMVGVGGGRRGRGEGRRRRRRGFVFCVGVVFVMCVVFGIDVASTLSEAVSI